MRALFSGPHGIGKTLASEVVAGRLAVDLHSVALDAVVSKYIGETEKNLRRIFLRPRRSTSSSFWMKLTPSWARGRKWATHATVTPI
jgi:SpoVK/Ycf46/Vps4 family AAA+-type ATPase